MLPPEEQESTEHRSELKPVFLADGKRPESVLQESEELIPFAVILSIQEHMLAIDPKHCIVFCRGTIETVASLAMHIWEKMVKQSPARFPEVMGEQIVIALDEGDWREYYRTLLRLHKRYGPPRCPLYVKGDLRQPFAFLNPEMTMSDFDAFKTGPTWFATPQGAREMV